MYLITNIQDNTLTTGIINESTQKIKYKVDKDIENVIYINNNREEVKWDLGRVNISKYELNMENIDKFYKELENIMEPPIKDKNIFVNIIVNTNFLAYAILEIAIKKFNVQEVFIINNGKLEKGHPCGCAPETMGI
ncbi:hypothetical protein [Methanobrevibacter filiformis]|uniref:Uncharacterized protein n=1 Tax=Methanobrevibacter filiformis TaxID=55758 RepID=A0A165Z4Y3_9EURY|nr:hypothetical protein [Methanobrevibacter filiformis]KZX10252.1 hypothetical protein MBFIL_18690 [Methanobrevibacter filiformis]